MKMKISEAIRAVSDEYDADVARAQASSVFADLLVATINAEYDEIDQELPRYIADIARGMGVPKGSRLPDYVYQACRMSFRLGMRVQRKIDHPDQITTPFCHGLTKKPAAGPGI